MVWTQEIENRIGELPKVVFPSDGDTSVCHVSRRCVSFNVTEGTLLANGFEIKQVLDFASCSISTEGIVRSALSGSGLSLSVF